MIKQLRSVLQSALSKERVGKEKEKGYHVTSQLTVSASHKTERWAVTSQQAVCAACLHNDLRTGGGGRTARLHRTLCRSGSWRPCWLSWPACVHQTTAGGRKRRRRHFRSVQFATQQQKNRAARLLICQQIVGSLSFCMFFLCHFFLSVKKKQEPLSVTSVTVCSRPPLPPPPHTQAADTQVLGGHLPARRAPWGSPPCW